MNSKTDQDFTADRIKHLEVILSAEAHMANSSAWVKRMALLIVSGIFALSMSLHEFTYKLYILVLYIISSFWFMDTLYHYKERAYRELYDEVRKEDIDARPDFRMIPFDEKSSLRNFLKCLKYMFYPPVFPFYFVVAFAITFYFLF